MDEARVLSVEAREEGIPRREKEVPKNAEMRQ